MSGLNILGGLGAGVMQGSQFIRQRDLDNENRQHAATVRQQNQARLDMMQSGEARAAEQFEWQKQDRGTQAAQQQRAAQFQTLRQSTYDRLMQEQGDAFDPVAADVQVFKDAVDKQLVPKEELEPLLKQVQVMRQRGLMAALYSGDTEALGREVSKGLGREVRIQIGKGPDGVLYSVVGQDGRLLSQITQGQLAALRGGHEILADQERLAKLQTEQAKGRNYDASAAASRAQAGKYGAETEERRMKNQGLALLSPQDRLRADKGGGGPLSTIGKEAADLVAAGIAKDQAEALKLLRTDKRLGQAVRAVAENPDSFLLSQKDKAKAIREFAAALGEEGPEEVVEPPPAAFRYVPGQGLIPAK